MVLLQDEKCSLTVPEEWSHLQAEGAGTWPLERLIQSQSKGRTPGASAKHLLEKGDRGKESWICPGMPSGKVPRGQSRLTDDLGSPKTTLLLQSSNKMYHRNNRSNLSTSYVSDSDHPHTPNHGGGVGTVEMGKGSVKILESMACPCVPCPCSATFQ